MLVLSEQFTTLAAELIAALRQAQMPLPLAVAYSGGADSTALLLAAHSLWPGQVYALHVHHGLQEAADTFLNHGKALCAAHSIPFYAQRVQAHAAQGQSPEDAARRARYAALQQLAQSVHDRPSPLAIALGQHADDQIETLLIALSRGAGLPGLAAMPAHWQAEGLDWYRPFLHISGLDLRVCLLSAGIAWVEDPSNALPIYTRNRIRLELLPVLEQVFPQFRQTFARSCRHAAQAQVLLEELAHSDLEAVGNPPAIAALQQLSEARLANVLRYWLARSHSTSASSAQLEQLQQQIRACTTRGHKIALKVGRGMAGRAGAYLQFKIGA